MNAFFMKIVIIGDSGCGKSCLMLRFTDAQYQDDYIATIGVDFRFRTVSVDNQDYKLQMWDTAGQERFQCIARSYYRHTQGIVMCYDISNRDSFMNLKHWLNEVDRVDPDLPKIIVGTKCDLPHWQRQVKQAEAKEFALIHNCGFIEVSAKSSVNIEPMFIQLVQRIVAYHQKKRQQEKKPDEHVTSLEASPAAHHNRRCCS